MPDLLSMATSQDYLKELNAHYKAVRERLNGPYPKPIMMAVRPEPEPEPEHEEILDAPIPPVESEVEDLSRTRGMFCSINVRRKMNEVLKEADMSWQELMRLKRDLNYVRGRAEAYLLLHELGWSLTRTGNLCGGRDHTTVLHGLKMAIKAKLTKEEIREADRMGMNLVKYYDWKRSK